MSSLFISRPVATTLLMFSLAFFGFWAYRGLPVSDLPSAEFPVILVTAQLPGANPETMASSVATPLERQFTTIAGLDEITSRSTTGSTQITLFFSLNRDIDAAAQDVQAAISAAAPLLPPDLPSPPTYRKVNPADQPILYIALTSSTLPLSAVTEYADTLMAQRISTVEGVAQVLVFGSQKYAVRVQVDPYALAERGIGMNEIANAISSANVNLPTGLLDGPDKAWTVRSLGQLERAEAYEPLIVAYRDGNPVRLRDVATALDSVENDKTIAWFRDEPAIVLAIQRQPGSNTVAVSRAVRELLPTFREDIPASIEMEVLFDQAESIQDSVDDVQLTLLIALALVVITVFLFLRNLTATVIPSLVLPISILATFAVMWLMGYSLNNLSLLALTLSIGFVIDDGIVMLENIVRHREMGKSAMNAAHDGAKEITFTIISMTVSLAAVFIPILFLGGIIGRFFREFSVTIAAAILWSGAVSLSLTPMLSSRFLREQREQGRFYRASERAFERSLGWYDRALQWALRHRFLTLLLSLAVLVSSFVLAAIIPKGFLPSEDTGQIFSFTEGPEDASFSYMKRHQRELNRVILENPNVESLVSTVGSFPGIPSNSGVIFVRLKERKERDKSAAEILEELRPRLDEVVGIRAYPQIPQPLSFSGTLTTGIYQYTLTGPNRAELYRVAQEIEEALRPLPQLVDVNSDLDIRSPQLLVQSDRDKASALGLPMIQIEETLNTAYSARQISYIYGDTDTYRVIVQVSPEFQEHPDALSSLWLAPPTLESRVASALGPRDQPALFDMVPLESFATLIPSVGPLSVNHSGQLPSVTISFNLPPGVSLGDAIAAINTTAAPLLTPEIRTDFAGAAEAFQESFFDLAVLLVIAILVIYVVLGVLYESFIHPITILTALPFAGFGALLTLLVFGAELDVYAFVGIIMLVGLVKKNGILMVDFAQEAKREGMGTVDAIHHACLVRFRPIMMTTVTALAGTLPIALALGAGAESRRPLGLAVVGGLLFSQSLTLFVTPVFFVYMDRFQSWAGDKLRRSR